MKDTKTVKFDDKSKEKQVNDFIALNLNQNAGKLINQSSGLINKFKNLNDELKEIIHLEKDMKLKEVVTGNKLLDLMNLEKRLKDKNSNKVELQNVLECYLMILKNNEELLNRKIDDLKLKDANLRQKEFILNKITKIKGKSEINFDNIPHELEEPSLLYNNNDIDLNSSQIEKTSKLNSAKIVSKTKPIINATALRNSMGKINNDNGMKNQPETGKNKIGVTAKQQLGQVLSPQNNNLKSSIGFNPVSKADDNLKRTARDGLKVDDAPAEKKRLNRSVVVERKPIDTKKENVGNKNQSKDLRGHEQFDTKSSQMSGVKITPETPREVKFKVSDLRSVQVDKRSVNKIEATAAQKKFETNAIVSSSKPGDKKNDNSNNKNVKGQVVIGAQKVDPSKNSVKPQPDKKEIKETKIDPAERDRKLQPVKVEENKTQNSDKNNNILIKSNNTTAANTNLNNSFAGNIQNDKNTKKSVTSPTNTSIPSITNKPSDNIENKLPITTTSISGSVINLKKDIPGKNLRYGDDDENVNNISSSSPTNKRLVDSTSNLDDNLKPDSLKSNLFNEVKTKVVTKTENEIKLMQIQEESIPEKERIFENEIENDENNAEVKKEKRKRRKKSRKSREDNSLDISQRENSKLSVAGEEKFMVRSSIFGSRNSSLTEDQLDRSDILKNSQVDPFDPTGGFLQREIEGKIYFNKKEELSGKKILENESKSGNESTVDLFKHSTNDYNAENVYDSVIDNLSDDDNEKNLTKRIRYQDALKRMQEITDQSQQIEASMKQFANSLHSLSISRDS